MKRSEINAVINTAIETAKKYSFLLPPFARLDTKMFKALGDEFEEIIENKLGWDITDFGSGDFLRVGLTMLTIRNGSYYSKKFVKPYAEKLLIVEEGQVTPFHFHKLKMEDIINRGGGNLVLRLYNAKNEKEFAKGRVLVSMDGRNHYVDAGSGIVVKPGESITLHREVFHTFWAEKGRVMLGEVSAVNDDFTDNFFYERVGRFPEIEEDVPPAYYLIGEYEMLFGAKAK